MHSKRLPVSFIALAHIRQIRFVCSVALALLTTTSPSLAGSATWNLNPLTNDWNTAANWTPETVPDGETDVATFDVSNVTDLSVSDYVFLDSIVFNPGASAYSIVFHGAIDGAGIVNNSGIAQNIDSSANLAFSGNATAGEDVVYTNNGEAPPVAFATVFNNQANAGSATFINKGHSPSADSAYMVFRDDTSAANSTIINESGDTYGARLDFQDNATAGSSSITLQPGAILNFDNQATAENAIVIADGAKIIFQASSTGALARVILTGGSMLNLFAHNPVSAMSIGSLEGDNSSRVGLGYQQLAIGGNGLSTTFSGVIASSGSILKVGRETLTLTGANTYSGGTKITAGTLIVQAPSGSATGTGPVHVTGGTLRGTGTIAGRVAVGTGNGRQAFLAPGVKGPGNLTINDLLTFNSGGNYQCELSLAGQGRADQVSANGVTIDSGAQFIFRTKGNHILPIGTVFTVINNTAATPISGTFSNLPDGATLVAGNNTLQVSYEGGDGNDLTLTVVP
jgi:autotransporter-associated beta strand protein